MSPAEVKITTFCLSKAYAEEYKTFFDEHHIPYTVPINTLGLPCFEIPIFLNDLIYYMDHEYEKATGTHNPTISLLFIFQPLDNFAMFIAIHGNIIDKHDLRYIRGLYNQFHSYMKQISNPEIIK